MIDYSKATLEEKVGQLFMPTVSLYTMEKMSLDYVNIQKYSIGGIIYFGFLTKEEYSQLSMQLQQSSKYPMLISIDQEGGKCFVHLCKKKRLCTN
jgi:beta-N-acetylhexosaminidase